MNTTDSYKQGGYGEALPPRFSLDPFKTIKHWIFLLCI